MTRFWWVRHGPTHKKAAIGWSDPPADLSDTAALERLSAHLPDAPVVSSDLSRAVATADAIQRNRQRLPHLPDIREMNYGAWEGLGFDTIAQRDPDISHAFWTTPGDIAPPEGESWNSLSTRVRRAIDTLSGQHDDIIAVAHFGTILAALQYAGGFDPAHAFAFKIDNLSVTRLDRIDMRWRIHGVNHTP